MRFLSILLVLCLALLFFSCSTTSETTQEETPPEETLEAVENTVETSVESVEEPITVEDLDPNKNGGFFKVSSDGEALNVRTKYADNGLLIDNDNKRITIMSGNTDSNISIDLKEGKEGSFDIDKEGGKSANVTINMTMKGEVVSAVLTQGTVEIDQLDESKGIANGSFEGKSADGKEFKGEFQLVLATQ